MKLSEDQISTFTQLCSTYISIGEMAIVLEVDTDELNQKILTPGSQEFNIFHRERILRKSKIQASIFSMAEAGSSPAQTMSLQIIKDQELNEFS